MFVLTVLERQSSSIPSLVKREEKKKLKHVKLLFVNVVEQQMFSNLNLLKQNKSQPHEEKKSPPADTLNKTDNTTGPGGKLNPAQRSLKCAFLRQKLKFKGRVCPTRVLGRRVEAKTSHKSLKSAFRTRRSLRKTPDTPLV